MSTGVPSLPQLTDDEEEELLAHALALQASNGDGKERLRVFADRNTLRRARPLLWQLAARGLMSPRLLGRMLPVLADDVRHASDAELWGTLTQVPAGLGELTPCLIDDYPIAVDTLFMEAAQRAPAVAAVARLPAHVAAALPLVQRRLGLPCAEPPPALLQQLLAVQLVQAGREQASTVTLAAGGLLEGRMVLGDEVEQLVAFATIFWPAATVERALAAELARKRRKRLQLWAALAAADAAQTDRSGQATLERLRRTPEADTAERDRLARLAAERFHAEGRPLPEELDAALVFACATRGPTPGWRRAIEALRAFPRDRLLRRFDAVVSAGWVANRFSAPVAALCAHPDPARLRHLLEQQTWRIGGGGADTLAVLFEELRKCAPDNTDRAAWLRINVGEAVSYVTEIDPAWDDVFETIHEEEARAFVERLPPERRGKVVMQGLRKDRDPQSSPWAAQLDLLDDASLEAAVQYLAMRRNPRTSAQKVEMGFARAGARVEAPLHAQLTGHRDEAAQTYVDAARISEEAAAAILGGALRTAVVAALHTGDAYLDTLTRRLRVPRQLGELHLPSGRLALVCGDAGTPLAHAVAPGAYPVYGWRYYTSAMSAEATAGVVALAVRFSAEKPTRWERDPGFSCEISLCLMDAARARDDSKAMEAELERAEEACFTCGFTLAGAGPRGARAALVAYIGEVPDNERLYWGLDANGAPVIALCGF
ncbi:hypothetical protein A7982_12362 [Minicystis rosea]|nr:hypothetical protein A7982_12362 [Minicystis rosea]